MRAASPNTIDLDALVLRSGGAEVVELDLAPAPPVIGGEELALAGWIVRARVDVSRTTSGYALRLRLPAEVEGSCWRCLGAASQGLEVDAREVDQASENDPELLSPYVTEGVLDVAAWVHDAITLAVPERLLCREDCAGLCEECGFDLNGVERGSHAHESKLDPRFAKLRELTE